MGPNVKYIDMLPLGTLVLVCATIGLAPFTPPHVWEKLVMLFNGTLTQPIDIFDLAMHGLPWVALLVKLARLAQLRLGSAG